MFIFGITGGTGAGKTSALRALKSIGALTLDCDAVYHELLLKNEEMKSKLASRFGDVLRSGAIDRARLGEIAFNDPSALRDLNAITHKYVSAEIGRKIAQWDAGGGKAVAAIDAIALIESGIGEKCDVVVGVTAPAEVRISRIMRRDCITRELAQMRINAQKPDSFYRENCDYIIESKHKRPADFEEACKKFFADILKEKNT